MTRTPLAFLAAILVLIPLAAMAGENKAQTSIVLDDPAGDVEPISTGDGTAKPYDVSSLEITSDGTFIVVKVELAEPPGDFASDAVNLEFDVDNDPATGVAPFRSEEKGFDYEADVLACIEYDNGGSACVGALGNTKVRGRYTKVRLRKYGDSWVHRETVESSTPEATEPFSGTSLRARIPYADLGVKSGQVVRILPRESSGRGPDKGYWKPVLLRLK